MKPIRATHTQLVALLKDILQAVESGDSLEGSFEYMLPDDDFENFDVQGSIRLGAKLGLNSIRLIGEM